MPKKSNKTNIGLIIVLIIIVLFFVVYLFVPFLNNNFLTKVFSPFCGIKKLYQGQEYLPDWCLSYKTLQNLNLNKPANENINKSTNNNTTGLANPAAVKCQEDGGSLESYTTQAGEAALCVFADKSICNQWEYFRGECSLGECFKECRAVGTKNEGWYNSCTGARIELDKCGEVDEVREDDGEDAVKENDTVKDEKAEAKSIKLSSPVPNEQLSSPFTVKGQSIVKDNKVYVRVKNTEGTVLIEETATAINQPGSEWAEFEIEISYEFNTTKEGFVEVYSLDQDDREINLISLPVKF